MKKYTEDELIASIQNFCKESNKVPVILDFRKTQKQ